jgi:hypothetical protein
LTPAIAFPLSSCQVDDVSMMLEECRKTRAGLALNATDMENGAGESTESGVGKSVGRRVLGEVK